MITNVPGEDYPMPPTDTPAQAAGKVMALVAIIAILAGIWFIFTDQPVAALCLLLIGGTSGLWSVVVLLLVAP